MIGLFIYFWIFFSFNSFGTMILLLWFLIFKLLSIFSYIIFSWCGYRPCEHLPSLGIRRTSQTFTFKSSSLKPLNQIKPNLAGMGFMRPTFKIMSDSPTLHSKWLLLIKIDILQLSIDYLFIINQKHKF